MLRKLEGWFDDLGGLTHVDGTLYRSPIPWRADHYKVLQGAGVRTVFSMTEDVAPQGDHIRGLGFDWRPHFWTDDEPPTVAEMDRFLAEYLALAPGTRALVHCNAGWGRTGSAVSCALMATRGWDADAAMRHFWSRVPRAEAVMVRNGQAAFVREYEARLRERFPVRGPLDRLTG